MSTNNRKKIFVFADWFEPGYKAGGPIRSCVNFANYMKADYEVAVFTLDRDLGDEHPYKNIAADRWMDVDGYKIFYASPAYLSWKNIRSEVDRSAADFIYLNSMFSKYFTIYPLLMKRMGVIKGRVILAPRGMLKKSALAFRSFKKRIFLQVIKSLSIHKLVCFQATDNTESLEIKSVFGSAARISQLSNFPGRQRSYSEPPAKIPGELSLIFVGRIHPIKNLFFLLEILSGLDEKIALSIVAPVKDEEYWRLCQSVIQNLPSNISVSHYKEIEHREIEKLLQAHHGFVLPTTGENFGHAIFEALAAGRPVVISDQTPWHNLLASQAGWDLPLQNPQAFRGALKNLAAMNYEQLNTWCKQAWAYCFHFIADSTIKRDYLKLFS